MDETTQLMIKTATVAACIRSEDDSLFTGVNVENSSYGLTICAETSAICQMVADGKRQIKSIVLMAGDNALCAPCGACRQCINEFSTPQTLVHLCNQQTVLKTMSIDELLPMAFKFTFGSKK
jgi:cytidine deaminase